MVTWYFSLVIIGSRFLVSKIQETMNTSSRVLSSGYSLVVVSGIQLYLWEVKDIKEKDSGTQRNEMKGYLLLEVKTQTYD